MVANGDQVAPGTAIATYAVRKDYLAKNRDVVIRWAMAYLQGVKEFNAAAAAPDQHPDIVEILAQHHGAEQTRAGQGNRAPLELHERRRRSAGRFDHEHAGLLERQGFPFRREEGVAREQLFDLTVAKEAKDRLDREKPFGP